MLFKLSWDWFLSFCVRNNWLCWLHILRVFNKSFFFRPLLMRPYSSSKTSWPCTSLLKGKGVLLGKDHVPNDAVAGIVQRVRQHQPVLRGNSRSLFWASPSPASRTLCLMSPGSVGCQAYQVHSSWQQDRGRASGLDPFATVQVYSISKSQQVNVLSPINQHVKFKGAASVVIVMVYELIITK